MENSKRNFKITNMIKTREQLQRGGRKGKKINKHLFNFRERKVVKYKY